VLLSMTIEVGVLRCRYAFVQGFCDAKDSNVLDKKCEVKNWSKCSDRRPRCRQPFRGLLYLSLRLSGSLQVFASAQGTSICLRVLHALKSFSRFRHDKSCVHNSGNAASMIDVAESVISLPVSQTLPSVSTFSLPRSCYSNDAATMAGLRC
jgi:hypothetical protein